MISYEVYKVIHVVSVIAFFTLVAWGAFGQSKIVKFLNHVVLLFILVAGMGLLARLGISQGGGMPQWVMAKMAIWLVAGIFGILITGRLRRLAFIGIPLLLALAAVSAWLAIYRPAF